jgi:hypothetical protein
MKYLTAFLVSALAATALGQNSSVPAPESKRAAMARAAESHTFTKIDGKKISGRPTGFTPSTGNLKLKIADDSECTVELPTLSDDDRAYIKDWYAAYSLIADGKIRFTFHEKTNPDREFKGNLDDWDSMFPNMKYKDHWSTSGTTYDEILYEFRLENRGEQKLDDIVIEYCIYHQTTIQEESRKSFYGAGKTVRVTTETGTYDRYDPPAWYSSRDDKYEKLPKQTVTNTVQGIVCLGTVPPGEKVAVLSDPVKIVKKSQERTTYPNPPQINTRGTLNRRTIEGELTEIRCRVYVPTEAGNYAMLEF